MGLGSILGGIGSLAAAPFTGGTSLAWLPAALAGGGAAADLLKGSGSSGSNSAPAGGTMDQATLEALLPQLRQLIQLMQQTQQRKALFTDPGASSLYGTEAPQGSAPIQGAIAKMAYGMLPNWVQQGMDVPQSTAQMLPLSSPSYQAPPSALGRTPATATNPLAAFQSGDARRPMARMG